MHEEHRKPGGEAPFTKKKIILREYPAERSTAPLEEGDTPKEAYREYLADIVHRKAMQEFRNLLYSLKTLPTPEEIIRGSHEADIKEYLVEALHCRANTLQQLQALVKLPKPLQALYEYWEEERDDPLIAESLNCVRELGDSLIKQQKMRGKPSRQAKEDR